MTVRLLWAIGAISLVGCQGWVEPGGPRGLQAPNDPDAVGTTTPTAARLNRLTRQQYRNTVRDLLGVEIDMDLIAPDEHESGFARNTTTPVGDLLVGQYMTLAEQVALQAAAAPAQLMGCEPDDQACWVAFLPRFGRSVYRRPLTPAELTAYEQLVETARSQEDGATALEWTVATMLQSPHFLYFVELGPAGSATETVRLTDYELATRLAYFLWNSTPDEALLDAAAHGLDESTLRGQVDRMLADDRAAGTVRAFVLQWLELDDQTTLTKDEALYPGFSRDLSRDMWNETARFADHVIRLTDGTLETLLTASYSFPSFALLDIYGVPQAAAASADEPTQLDPTQRAGLLTHASVLAAHAHPDQTSPVHRGVLIREQLLCQALAPPPPNVNDQPPEPSSANTARERFAAHSSNPTCAGCHRLIDPIGFGFENYDAVGAYRTEERGETLDTSGALTDTVDADGVFQGVVELAHRLAQSQEVRRCFVQQWTRFAPGNLTAAAVVDALDRSFAEANGNVRRLLVSLATSEFFKYRGPIQEGSPEEGTP